MDKSRSINPGGGNGVPNDARCAPPPPALAMIEAAMMEELGLARVDDLPLADRGPVIDVFVNARVPKPRQPNPNNPWQSYIPDDIDPSAEGLDDMHGGMLYRMRRGTSSNPAARGSSGLGRGSSSELDNHTSDFTSARGQGHRGSRGRASTMPSRGQRTSGQLPAYVLDTRRQVTTNAHIDTTIAKLRALPNGPKLSSTAPQNSSTSQKTITAQQTSSRGTASKPTRGTHQQIPISRPPFKFSLVSSDAFLAHMARSTPAPPKTSKQSEDAPLSLVKPPRAGLAGSRWAHPEDAATSIGSSIPVTSVQSITANTPSSITPLGISPQSTAVNPLEQATTVATPQAIVLQPKAIIAALEQVPIPPPVVDTLASTKVNTLAMPGRVDLEIRSEVNITKNGAVLGKGVVALYKNDDPNIISYLEIVIGNITRLNEFVEETDIFKAVSSILTYRQNREESPVWKIYFQLPHHASSFVTIFSLRCREVRKHRAGKEQFQSLIDDATQTVPLLDEATRMAAAQHIDPEDQEEIERPPTPSDDDDDFAQTPSPIVSAVTENPILGPVAPVEDPVPTEEDNLYDADSDIMEPTAPLLIDFTSQPISPAPVSTLAAQELTILTINHCMITSSFALLSSDPDESFLERSMRIGRFDGNEADMLSGANYLVGEMLCDSEDYQNLNTSFKRNYCLELSKKLLEHARRVQFELESDAIVDAVKPNQVRQEPKIVKRAAEPRAENLYRGTNIYRGVYSDDPSDDEDEYFDSRETQSGQKSNDSVIQARLDVKAIATREASPPLASSFTKANQSFEANVTSNILHPTASLFVKPVPQIIDEPTGNSPGIIQGARPGATVYDPSVLYSLRSHTSGDIEVELKRRFIYKEISPGPKTGPNRSESSRPSTRQSCGHITSPQLPKKPAAIAGNPPIYSITQNQKTDPALWATLLSTISGGSDTVSSSPISTPKPAVQPSQGIRYRTGLSQDLADFHLTDKIPVSVNDETVPISEPTVDSFPEPVETPTLLTAVASSEKAAGTESTGPSQAIEAPPPKSEAAESHFPVITSANMPSIGEVLRSTPGLSASMWATEMAQPPPRRPVPNIARAVNRPVDNRPVPPPENARLISGDDNGASLVERQNPQSRPFAFGGPFPVFRTASNEPILQTVLVKDPNTGLIHEITGMMTLSHNSQENVPFELISSPPFPARLQDHRRTISDISSGFQPTSPPFVPRTSAQGSPGTPLANIQAVVQNRLNRSLSHHR